MILIIKILFTVVWLKVGYESYKWEDGFGKMITAIAVLLTLYFMWLY